MMGNNCFWHFWSIKNPLHGRNTIHFLANVQGKQKTLHSDLESEKRSVVLKKHDTHNRDESILRTIEAFVVYQDSKSRNKSNGLWFLFQASSKSEKNRVRN